MEAEWGSPKFVADQFKRWYGKNSATVPGPTELQSREFAFLTFHGRTMYRHIMFSTLDEVQRYLRNTGPAHSYHSSSYYEEPDADMANKGWLGADLVFDIDADHFHLPCQKRHDHWVCRNCGKEGTGHPPELCDCGKAQFTTENWLCEECLQAAKNEAQKLLDILIEDFGIDPGELITNFSGHRGYHVHVRSSKVRGLDSRARREIVDYIMGTGLGHTFQGFDPQRKGANPAINQGGWRRRTSQALYDYMSTASKPDLVQLGIPGKEADKILGRRERVLDYLLTRHPTSVLPHINEKHLKKIIQAAKHLQASEIDTVVTTDIHRLIRMTKTLHGKTGWQVQNIPYGRLPDYDPLMDAVTITGQDVKLEFKHAEPISILGEKYGPYMDEVAELPLEAALYYLCKKGARVIQ